MDVYASEKEQVEALRKWWKENGTSMVTGLLLGLGVLAGGKAWFDYQDGRSAHASDLYSQLMNALNAGKDEEARVHANEIISKYSSTGYAPLTALALARIAVNSGELPAAQAQLQWALEHADSDSVRHTARLRLVRVLMDQEAYAQAGQLLSVNDAGVYAYRYLVLQGDLALVQGKQVQAKAAFKAALDQMPEQAPDAGLIRIKYENLAGEVVNQ